MSTVNPEIKTTNGELANTHMTHAFNLLKKEAETKGTRELSLAITYLEIAMMFNNKDRTLKGEIKPYKTHVAVEDLTEMPK